jgi:hypothetical protein
MQFDPPDYAMHRARIEEARYKKKKRRQTEKKQIANSKRARLKKLPTKALKGELIRRAIEGLPPEERAVWLANAKVGRARKADLCDHSKLPPKFRASGKHAGRWVCPSCHTPVPEPKPAEEDLVV